MRRTLAFLMLTMLVGVLSVWQADAKTYVGKQRNISFSRDDVMDLIEAGNVEVEAPEDVAAYLFRIPLKKLMQQAESLGLEPEIMDSLLYIGEDQLRLDTTLDMMGGISYLILLEEQKALMLFRDRNEYVEMTFEQIKQMSAKAEQVTSNLLDSLPPEARARLDQLPPEIRQQMQGQLGASAETSVSSVSVDKTGRKGTINNFPCEEYLVEARDWQQLWISQQHPGLRRSFEALLTQLPNFSKSEEDTDETAIWKEIDKGWPVVIKTLKSDSGRAWSISLDIQEMVSMKEQSLPPDTFSMPDRARKTTLQSLMQGMMPMGKMRRR